MYRILRLWDEISDTVDTKRAFEVLESAALSDVPQDQDRPVRSPMTGYRGAGMGVGSDPSGYRGYRPPEAGECPILLLLLLLLQHTITVLRRTPAWRGTCP